MIQYLGLSFAFLLLVVTACRTSSFQWVEKPDAVPGPTFEANQATPLDPGGTGTLTKMEDPVQPVNEAVPMPVASTYEELSESFYQQGVSSKADILIVIDNSDTMKEEQENMSTKLKDLLTSIKDADWQIGVITTTVVVKDGFDSCILDLIQKGDKDVDEKFRRALSPGTDGSRTEEGVRQAVNGLRCGTWLRPDSSVAVLIVSDEDNCSKNGVECFKQPSHTEQYLIDFVEGDLGRVVGKNAGFYGIFSPPKSPCATAENVAVQYQRLVDYKSNGEQTFGNICDSSYKSTLERISGKISRLLSSQFALKKIPDAGSLTIMGSKSDGSAIKSEDFMVMGRTIMFKAGQEPALNSEFLVRYRSRL